MREIYCLKKWVEICDPKLTFRGAGFYNDNNKS